MSELQVPSGFERHFRKSGLTDPWEPLYSRIVDETHLEMGLHLGPAHCNSRGLVHGGLIASLADNSMGLNCAMALRATGRSPDSGLVTISLNTDFLGAAKLGEWLQFEPESIKAGGAICFARALIRTDAQIVARAAATFKVL